MSATAKPKPDKGNETPEKFLVIVLDKADSNYVGFVVEAADEHEAARKAVQIRKENSEAGDESDEEAGLKAVDIYPQRHLEGMFRHPDQDEDWPQPPTNTDAKLVPHSQAPRSMI